MWISCEYVGKHMPVLRGCMSDTSTHLRLDCTGPCDGVFAYPGPLTKMEGNLLGEEGGLVSKVSGRGRGNMEGCQAEGEWSSGWQETERG